MPADGLPDLVAAELTGPVDSRVGAMAAALAARYGASARAVLFYGSCLRADRLDGLMLDFYLIVDSYRNAYRQRWLATANRLLPPNVFPFEHDGLAAKYAVLSEADFIRLMSPATTNVSVWARFAQPSRLVWFADVAAHDSAVAVVSMAAPTLLAAARPMLPDRIAPLEIWRRAFALTYAAELRAERGGRNQSIVDAEPDRYRAFLQPALAAAALPAKIDSDGLVRFDPALTAAVRKSGERRWARRRIEGKALTLLRLMKASSTFAGGLDYLAWKINRHADARIAIRPWQRRWPIIGAISLLPRLLLRGSIR